MPAIKAKNFSAATIQKHAKMRPPIMPTTITGVPGCVPGAVNTALLKTSNELLKHNVISSENMSTTDYGLATQCLNALCITAKEDLQPAFSLLRNTHDNSEISNLNNPRDVLATNKKDDGSKKFPSTNDPWHEHDNMPPEYIVQKRKNNDNKTAATNINPASLVNQLQSYNMSPKTPDRLKLKQFKGVNKSDKPKRLQGDF